MVLHTDRYTKTMLTLIAFFLFCLVLKGLVFIPTADALTRLPGVTDEKGNPVMLTDVYVRNTPQSPVETNINNKRIEVYWTKPMPVFIVEQKNNVLPIPPADSK